MRTGKFEFRPRLWPSLATLLMFPALLALGFWQLDRAEQKAAMAREYHERQRAPSLDLDRLSGPVSAEAWRWRRVEAAGEYQPPLYLLDNQVRGGRAGYEVYTAFQPVSADFWVLVDRGFVPAPPERATPPALTLPAGTVPLSGMAVEPPQPGLTLAGAAMERLGPGIFRLQRLDLEAIAAQAPRRLLPFVVRLDEHAPHGYDRQWPPPGFGRERHLGYAFQWFALAATLLVIYLVMNVKKTGNTESA
jgi:surfeit locus 1 family protein